MAKRIGGSRRKSRGKLRKNIRERGKLSLTKYFQEFKIGDRVSLKANPGIQKGMYYPRFHGRAGVITKKQGECYYVTISDLGKEKQLIVHPIHLKRI